MSHYKRYPKYRDSGAEWIGEVPEHWGISRIKFVASIGNGSTPSRDRTDYWANGSFPWLTSSCVNHETVDEAEKYVTTLAMAECHLPVVQPPAILVGITGQGRTRGMATTLAIKATINQHIAFLKAHEAHVRTKFLRCCVDAAYEWLRSRSEGNGGTKGAITCEQLGDLSIALPAITEQDAILTWLSVKTGPIDALIAKKTRFVELLKEKRQALITRAVTKGLDPDAAMKDSGVEWIGEVPAHWRVPKLRHIATVQTGVAKGKDVSGLETISVPYLRVANVQDGYLDLTDLATIEVPEADLPRYLLQPGDVLMNEGGDGDKLGRGHIWPGKIHPCIHQNHVFAVRPHGVSSAWLNTYTGSIPAQRFFAAKAKQTTNLASISSGSLMDLPVPQPPAKEQEAILMRVHRSVKRIDELLAKTTRSLALLKERRAAFTAAAVTGQIDLRDTVPPAQRDTACTS